MDTTQLSSICELHPMVQGGMPGAERLGSSQDLMGLLQKQREAGRIWAAICAAPAVVLEAQGWLKHKKATCHPAFVERLADQRRVRQVTLLWAAQTQHAVCSPNI